MPLGPLAHQIELGVPLPVTVTERTDAVELAAAMLDRDAVERMRIARAETVHDAGFVGHGEVTRVVILALRSWYSR